VTKEDRAIAVLDIDSDKLAQFDEDDVAPLTEILSLLKPYL
jgi:putative methionine-R-sulfoxide reductase with GAF domain